MLSPCIKQVSLSTIYAVDKLMSVARDIDEHQNWFYDLVDAIGVSFCGINRDTSTSINFSKIIKDDREESLASYHDFISNFVIDDGVISEMLKMMNEGAEVDE
jgi:hypothetical protein